MLDRYWLPPTEDWPRRISALEDRSAPGGKEDWRALSSLASTRLSFVRMERLDQALLRLFGEAPPEWLQTRPVRLALLGSSTVSHLVPAIRVAALQHGLWVSVYEAPYGQYRQELADPSSGLHAFKPDAALLILDADHLLAGSDPVMSASVAEAAVVRIVDDLAALWLRLRQCFGAHVLQQTLLPVAEPLLGMNEDRLPGSRAAMLASVNEALRKAAVERGVSLLAIDKVAAQYGITSWHDVSLWHRAKQEVTPRAAPMYGDLVARLLGAEQGRSAKCLVLDLDNTLWGGVIGDDGVEGIVLGQGTASGEAFVAFQRYAAALARRGIILAVCSKNDEQKAMAAFEQHPEMVLRRSDIAAFVANWNDKASNLREIAHGLNIGLDALVFVDDNPFERDLVRRELPMVAVPELPEDAALYARTIANAGFFEATALTEEDRARTQSYRANAERVTLQASATDMSAYLRSLDMRLVWRPFDAVGLQRIHQLINKTNQFNLTTRRYSQDEVAAVIADPAAMGLQFRLVDRFGDNGIIAVVIAQQSKRIRTMVIDTWLMSCRVLGRQVERAVLGVVAEQVGRLGIEELIGVYRPTAKNGMVRDHYEMLGFKPCGTDETEEIASYSLDLAHAPFFDGPIAIEKG